MSRPTFESDLDRVMDMGFGRRVLREIITMGMCDVPFSKDPLEMAYKLGQLHTAQDLDRRIRDISGDKWLLMHREMMALDEDEDKEPKE